MFILNNLLEMLNPLESAFTKKGEGGGGKQKGPEAFAPGPSQFQWLILDYSFE